MPARRTTLLGIAGAAACALAATGAAGHDTVARGPVFTHPTRIDNPFLPLSSHRRCEARGRVAGVAERHRPHAPRPHGAVHRRQVRPSRPSSSRTGAFEGGELVRADARLLRPERRRHRLVPRRGRRPLRERPRRGPRGCLAPGPRDPHARRGDAAPHPRVGSHWRFEDVPGVTTEHDTVITAFDARRGRERDGLPGRAAHPGGPLAGGPERVQVVRPRRRRDPGDGLGPARHGRARAVLVEAVALSARPRCGRRSPCPGPCRGGRTRSSQAPAPWDWTAARARRPCAGGRCGWCRAAGRRDSRWRTARRSGTVEPGAGDRDRRPVARRDRPQHLEHVAPRMGLPPSTTGSAPAPAAG